jgi:hypothetical protein
MLVPGQDANVSSQGRYLFPGGTILQGEVISSEAAPRPQLGVTRAQFLPGRDDIGVEAWQLGE